MSSNSKSKIDYNKPHFTQAEKQILKTECNLIRTKYPNHIPIIVQCDPKSDLSLSKNKFLVNNDVTFGQLLYIVRKKLVNDLHSTHALFLFINNTLPPTSAMISSIYSLHKNKDTGMLHIMLCKENTFGV